MIGSKGTNKFVIGLEQNSDIIWGSGGTSTYDIKDGRSVDVVYMVDPTVSAIVALANSPLYNQSDFSTFIINPTLNDRIIMGGRMLQSASYAKVSVATGFPYETNYGYVDASGNAYNQIVTPYTGNMNVGSYINGAYNGSVFISGFVNGDFGINLSGEGPVNSFPSDAMYYAITPDFFSYTERQHIGKDGSSLSNVLGSPSDGGENFQGIGNDYEQGNGGADTFVYDLGYGQLEVSEPGVSGDGSVLQLGSGITSAQLQVTTDSAGNVYLADGTVGDQVTLDNYLNGPGNGPQTIKFADNTTLSRSQVIAQATTGTSGADMLYGSSSADTFDGKGAPAGSQDYEQGNSGADTFIFNQGYGQLEINAYTVSGNTACAAERNRKAA